MKASSQRYSCLPSKQGETNAGETHRWRRGLVEKDLPGTTTNATIQPEFLKVPSDDKVEVLAHGANGNQTINDIPFRVH